MNVAGNDLREYLQSLPEKPGVYMMKDASKQIIYVGKAISLKSRVKSYFNNDKNKPPKVLAMLNHIDSFDYIIVTNEVEALILESNLIKENRPKYNILLRDDKSYPYIKITAEKFPRLMKVRQVSKDGARYFGPFPNAYAVNDMIHFLQDFYQLRVCNLNFDKGQELARPCLNHYIGKCLAPCVKKADEKQYLSNINEIEDFLKGKQDRLLTALKERMEKASADLQFEQAAKYRDQISAIELIMEKQRISNVNHMDMDLIAMARGEGYVCIQVFFMRSGKVVDREDFILQDDYQEQPEEIMGSFLKQFYLDVSYIPKEIIIEFAPLDLAAFTSLLSEKKGSKVHIHVPQRGNKVDLLKLVKANAQEMLDKFEKQYARRERIRTMAVKELEQLLDLTGIYRVEAYDISNISGVQSVGSMIVFEQGEKVPKEYRKFKIKTIEGSDDYGSLEEVLRRRLARGLKERDLGNSQSGFGSLPDLIMIDGGRGQVNVGQRVLDEFGLKIPVCGLVKDEYHKTRGIIYHDCEIPLKVQSPAFRLIYSIQEEAHRFAIQYHRKLREREMDQSILDGILGIGKTRKKELLRYFRSVDGIKKATLEELLRVPKMTQVTAIEIVKFFQRNDEKDNGGENEKRQTERFGKSFGS